MEPLNLTFLQSHLVWEDVSANLKVFSAKLNQLKNPTDVVVLPEMFTTGFSMNSKFLAEKMDGKSVTWMQMQSKKLQTVVLGSLIIEENGHFFNRLVVAFPNGDLKQYNKHHLFTLSGE
ncbi:MAG: nitrilase family protein, partial [Zetaproteobacteria bacterium]|nr:nitrilase family protein [Flavobacteriales bacterium]